MPPTTSQKVGQPPTVPGAKLPTLKAPEPTPLGTKEEAIRKGYMNGKSDYPTMDDVLSDWDQSEKPAKKEGGK